MTLNLKTVNEVLADRHAPLSLTKRALLLAVVSKDPPKLTKPRTLFA